MPQAQNNMSTTHKKMSVLIHQDGLSFFIYSSMGVERHILKTFKHESNPIEILQEIENIYEIEKDLNFKFKEVTLIYNHSIFTGVPASLYNENNQSDYLKYNVRLLDTDVISTDDAIEALDYRSIYIAYSNINNYFFDKYGDFNYYHYSTLALQKHYSVNDSLKTEIIIDVKESQFYITIFEKGSLLLHNSYPHQAAEDILYYTLFTAQHNHLDPEHMDLKIISSTKNDAVYNLLYTYVRNVSYVVDSNTYIENILCV
ncbi:response regulator [Nonlabens arenilitoris]|uniref:Response regulator n=1 Tax=Nonlabens arenilitoris TaxID=1217969 RepID=A0A2S7UCU5_9FLAO|nr:response regulator [Nonlabens arenilitoris]